MPSTVLVSIFSYLVLAAGASAAPVDALAGEPDLRERPLIGVPILWGFLPDGEGWQGGRLYNPDDGKDFRAELQLLSPTRLRVTACFGPFCRSQIWTRIHTP